METTTGFAYNFNHKKRGRAIIIVNGDFKEYYDEPVLVNGVLQREKTGLSKRECVQNELKMMKKFFRTLGFNIKCYSDLGASEMKNVLKQAAANEEKKLKENKEADCFACVICSHGIQVPERESGKLYLQHGIAGIDGYFLRTEDIISFFESSNCPALKDKPKLFFFQACRSNARAKTYFENFDVGIPIIVIADKAVGKKEQDTSDHLHREDLDGELSDTETDSEADDSDYQVGSQLDVSDTGGVHRIPSTDLDYVDTQTENEYSDLVTTIPCYNDMLLMFASSEGKFAFKSGTLGGWLIQSLYITLKEYGFERMDLLTFLNMVTYDTVQTRAYSPREPNDENDVEGKRNMRYYGSKVTPYITHMLRDDVYFNDTKLRKSVLKKIMGFLKKD